MAVKIRRTTSSKQQIRYKRKRRIRGSLTGSAIQPRLAVFRSNKHMYVQLIDDVAGSTLVAASTVEGEFPEGKGKNLEGAQTLGALVAKRALAKNISRVVFDRSGYLYHGRIKAVADAARAGGLQF